MIFPLAAAVVVAAWIFWQFPFSSTDTVPLPEVAGLADFDTAQNTQGEPGFVFYRRKSAGQYAAYGVGDAGNIVRKLDLPGDKIAKADGTSVSLAGKEGYITAPKNGAFYIWYPQIGQQVYVFNEKGNFLWEKDESHYLQALPYGRYIMAAAGDHSRILFMNPDFKIHADFQGVLFTRYLADDNPEAKSAQVCLGSLDGEIILAHLDRRLFARHKTGYALKSLACDFSAGELAAIVERTVEVEKNKLQKDFLLRMRFSLPSPKVDAAGESMRAVEADLDTLLSIELPLRTTSASPLVITENSTCFLQTAEGSANNTTPGTGALAVYYTDGKKSDLKSIPIAPTAGAEGTDGAPDRWNSQGIYIAREGACLFSHRSGRLLIAGRRGLLLDRSDLPVERLIARNNTVFLQTEKGILTLR